MTNKSKFVHTKCLSKRFSKVGNKSEVNRLGVKIVAANWCLDLCSVTSRIAWMAERTRCLSSSSSLSWLPLLSSTSSAEPIYSSSTCHGSCHLQRDHTWLHITDSCRVTETKTTALILLVLTETSLDLVSQVKAIWSSRTSRL